MTDRGWRPVRKLDGRVISVGNLQAGGAGKTPLVAHIARQAHERGQSCAILSRGYGGSWESTGGVLGPSERGAGAAPDPRLSGDEPALLTRLAPHAWIGVGASRYEQAQKVRSLMGREPDVTVLDDAFQHLSIRPDVRILAITSFGRSEVLYRDFDSAARYADLLVWTKGAVDPAPRFAGARAPWVKVRFQIPRALDERGNERGLLLVSGVADPASFESMVRSAGYRVEGHVIYADHFRYTRELAVDLLQEAERRACIVGLTQKDWVKWKTLGVSETAVRIFEPQLVFESGREAWERVLWGS